MKKLILTFFALIIGATYFMVYAQQSNINKRDSLNTQMKKIATSESKPDWIKFKEDVNIDPGTLFVKFKAAFDLKENDKMVLYKMEKDELGFTHYRYQQYYKNIKVDGATFIVHNNKKQITYAANGKIITGIDINIVPDLTIKKAIELTLKYTNAKEYMWQSEFWERDLKERTGKHDTSYYPSPQLIIKEMKNISLKPNAKDKQYFLAYQLDIYSSSPYYSQRIFIDANTGKILDSLPLQAD